MAKKQGKPSLSDQEAQTAVALLKELLKSSTYRGNKSALARDLGISQPAVTQLEDGTNRASLETLKAIAALSNKDYRDYLDPPATPIPRADSARYQFRDTLQAAREIAADLIYDDSPDLFTREQIQDAARRAAQVFETHEKPSILGWVDAIRLFLRSSRSRF